MFRLFSIRSVLRFMLVGAFILAAAAPAAGQSGGAPIPDILGWGYNAEGQASVPPDFSGDKAVAAGWFHSMALKNDGTVYTWGMNAYGQLGIGSADLDPRPTPQQVPGLTEVTYLAGGAYHSLALRADQTLWVWGNNNQGQLGNGSTLRSTLPIQVTGLGGSGRVRSAAGGWGHSLAVLTDGSVWAWGLNDQGQIGLTSSTQALARSSLSILAPDRSFAAAAVPVLTKDLYGDSRIGAALLGGLTGMTLEFATNSGIPFYSPVPIQVPGLTQVTAVAGGYYHSLALRADGTVWAWGDNQVGQLGLGYADADEHPDPQMVPGLTHVVAIAAGIGHNLALRTDGTLWAWGRNTEGQLGDGTRMNRYYPVQVTAVNAPVRSFTAGGYHSLATLSTGAIAAWGWNDNFQTNVPLGLSNASRVAAGFAHSLVLLANRPPWDVNGDHIVNILDLTLVGSRWFQMGPPGWIPEDVQPDGVINILDLTLIGAHWGETW